MFTRSTILDFTGKKLALSFIAHELVDEQRPPYVHLASTRRHSRDRFSQAFPVFRALPLSCIILNENRRTKNGGGLGTRLPLRVVCMYVSHALDCNCSCGDFRYIIDTASATCTCYQATRGIASSQASKTKAEMADKHAVSMPGCISKHQELLRQVSEGQSTMINYGYFA